MYSNAFAIIGGDPAALTAVVATVALVVTVLVMAALAVAPIVSESWADRHDATGEEFGRQPSDAD